MKIIGRSTETAKILAAIASRQNLLIEGPVGVGKTFLVQELLREKEISFERIDGDSRTTEQKLTGSFDPQLVLQSGYRPENFLEGPLVVAMRAGNVLFINELNRLPEGVQNVLLPAIDEKRIFIPKLGVIEAKEGFFVIATQNPTEFVATTHLSEAILDRFEWMKLDYQSADEERAVLDQTIGKSLPDPTKEQVVALIRTSRAFEGIRRGASIRAAISMGKLCIQFISQGKSPEISFREAARMALTTRLEFETGELTKDQILENLLDSVLKKKEP